MKIHLVRINKEIFEELVTLKLIDLNAKDRMFAIANKQKSGKCKTYFVVDEILEEYYKVLG